MSKLGVHPAAEIFPLMPEDEYVKLKEDIEKNGLQSSGLIHEGQILDGRNRYRACCELGIDMEWQETDADTKDFDPVEYVLTQNLHRRHLQPSQRAMIAAKMVNVRNGWNQHNNEGVQICTPSDDAAGLLKVSRRSVMAAKHVLDNGSAALIESVEAMTVRVSLAERLCKSCEDRREQTKLVREGREAIKLYLDGPAKKKPTRFETMRQVWEKSTPKERQQFIEWANQQGF